MKDKKRASRLYSGLIMAMMSLLLFTGCGSGRRDVRAGVIRPQPVGVSIEGQYVFREVIHLEEGRFVEEDSYRTFTAAFSLKGARIGLEKIEQPRYLSKLVNTFDYFRDNYRANPQRFGISAENMEVVKISASDQSFYEVFKLDSSTIAIVKGNNLIKLRKTDADTGEETDVFGAGVNEDLAGEDDYEPIAGVLIGLRDKRDEETGAARYRTLWITNDGELQEVYEVDDILFPRKEFWKLQVGSGEEDGVKKEKLTIFAITGTPAKSTGPSKDVYLDRRVDVTFVGNNYVSLLTSDKKDEDKDDVEKAMTISVDGYADYRALSINELDPGEGVKAFLNSLQHVVDRNSELKDVPIRKTDFLSNFIMRRYHGHWMMEGRFTAGDDEERSVYKVPVAMMPSERVVAYDALTIPWNTIKERIPQATDAFNAPGNSFILVRTPKYLMMYRKEGETLAGEPLQMVEIREEEEIIMAEWARGEFVRRWTEVAGREGRKIIFVQNRRR